MLDPVVAPEPAHVITHKNTPGNYQVRRIPLRELRSTTGTHPQHTRGTFKIFAALSLEENPVSAQFFPDHRSRKTGSHKRQSFTAFPSSLPSPPPLEWPPLLVCPCPLARPPHSLSHRSFLLGGTEGAGFGGPGPGTFQNNLNLSDGWRIHVFSIPLSQSSFTMTLRGID